MRYLSFTIKNYKAIVGPIVIDVSKKSLLPIIGTNECGKTTILHAIYAFDFINDIFDKNVRHLEDTTNLYKVKSPDATVSASIECKVEEFKRLINGLVLEVDSEEKKKKLRAYKSKRFTDTYSGNLDIERNIVSKKYKITSEGFSQNEIENDIARYIVHRLPYTLYYDDFRDSIEEQIEIVKMNDRPQGWLAVIEQLFKKTNDNYSVFDLPELEERKRKTLLDEVNLTLNQTLSRVWQDFKLEDQKAFEVKIEYNNERTEPSAPGAPYGRRDYVSFDVVEKDVEGRSKYFKVRDRSKGFFWFFNFVMKLEFNPKVNRDSYGIEAIYLLDEPGSYLHAAVQSRLCRKLSDLSKNNKVIFCTHSHYLINPDIIPLSSINIAQKENFSIHLHTIFEANDSVDPKSAFQPIYDALQLRPFSLDLNSTKVIILEGIYDYYTFDIFNKRDKVAFIPSKNADSIMYFITLMIGWRQKFCAIWDNDDEGNLKRQEAIKAFGQDLVPSLRVLDNPSGRKKIILQDLYDANELKGLKTALGLPSNTSFEKTVAAFKFSGQQKTLAKKMKITSANVNANIKQAIFS